MIFMMGVRYSRRTWLASAARFAAGAATAAAVGPLFAASNPVLEVAYAGSMGSLMEGALKAAAARDLGLQLHGRGQGANALARLIEGGSIRPDVFISVTPGPMQTLLQAGKATEATPVAATEMVIAYSAQSRYAAQLQAHPEIWWKVMQEPGFRFGRTDPANDPQGRNILFVMMLAAKKYGQPDLLQKLAGPLVNPQQISIEASVQSRLQGGQLDAASAYRIQPGPFHLPYIALPPDINLSGERVHAEHPEISLSIGGKTYFPEPLVYYASVMKDAPNPAAAQQFLAWLKGPHAQALFRAADYDAPGSMAPLHA